MRGERWRVDRLHLDVVSIVLGCLSGGLHTDCVPDWLLLYDIEVGLKMVLYLLDLLLDGFLQLWVSVGNLSGSSLLHVADQLVH